MEHGYSTHLDTLPFTKDQLKHMYKLFQSPTFNVKSNQPSSCSLAQKNNYLIAIIVSVNPVANHPWMVDSCAIDHMTKSSKFFSSYQIYVKNKKSKSLMDPF